MNKNKQPPNLDFNMGIVALGSGSVIGTAILPVAGLIPVAMWAVAMFNKPKKPRKTFTIPQKR